MPVPYNDKKDNETETIVQRYASYLNGPMGKNVMDSVNEGESFNVETSNYLLRVTKVKGKAIVDVVKKQP